MQKIFTLYIVTFMIATVFIIFKPHTFNNYIPYAIILFIYTVIGFVNLFSKNDDKRYIGSLFLLCVVMALACSLPFLIDLVNL
ncbi:hypothetical protein DY052_06070 [Apilactobacillus timberlakei]|uniref:hypothetical protein n=1 Tax=Apilactobacillus timberlakei TaxID=2008380 RepID=UPI001128EFBA|nr:hypothetical protein [Apilactobacillus timberlakei]TPR14990.1 hypothetical protein DY052_06070 [Apilactobacillus timberlakei]